MKWNKLDIQELMLRSLDFPLNPEEKKKLEVGLKQFPEIQDERDELLKIRTWLGELQAAPNPNFSQEVMKQLPKLKAIEAPILFARWLPRVAAACILAVVLTALGVYLSEGTFTTDAIIGIQDLAPEDAYTFLEN